MDPITEAVAWLGGAVSVITIAKAVSEWKDRHDQRAWERRQTTWIETEHGKLQFGSWIDRHLKRKKAE
jgi:hypothetical protein